MSCEVQTIRVIKKDSTSAFGFNLFELLEPELEDGQIITKIIVQVGPIQKLFEAPFTFPQNINLTKDESARLKVGINPVAILLFDENGQPKTAELEPKLQVVAEEEKVFQNDD